eukprot:m.83889 g.83889  ORF g.83889 m.83889 type:complete len:193 (-) comp25685_c0_seq1:323-901(-)
MEEEEPAATREPCPYRIIDDCGSAFAMGAIGGGIFHAAKGWRNSPPYQKISGTVQAVRMNAPKLGGSFAIWGLCFSSMDCSLLAIRGKEDAWNSVTAGFLTGGILAIRAGPAVALQSATFGGVMLGLIEGLQVVMNKAAHDQVSPVVDLPQLAPAPGGLGPSQLPSNPWEQNEKGFDNNYGANPGSSDLLLE